MQKIFSNPEPLFCCRQDRKDSFLAAYGFVYDRKLYYSLLSKPLILSISGYFKTCIKLPGYSKGVVSTDFIAENK